MNTNMNKGMQAMQARLAAMSPEERKAASAKAAAASAAAAKARAEQKRAQSAAGATPTPPTATATTEARVKPPVPEVIRSWDVCLLEGTDTIKWARVDAPGMKRAGRAAAKAHPGTKVQGCVLAGILKLTR